MQRNANILFRRALYGSLIAAMGIVGCSKLNQSGVPPQSTVLPSIQDTTAPTVGGGISSSVTPISTTLSWPAAADDQSSVANLQYKVVTAASSSSINTVALADAIVGSGLVMDWTSATTSVTAKLLPTNTTSSYAVLVRDEAGNKSLYSPVSAATPQVGVVHIQTLGSGNFLFIYGDQTDSNKGKFAIYDQTGGVVVAPTTFSAGIGITGFGDDIGSIQQAANTSVITYRQLADGFGHLLILQDNGTIVNDVAYVAEPTFFNGHSVAPGSGANTFVLTGRPSFSGAGQQGTGYGIYSATTGAAVVAMAGINNGGGGLETRGTCASSVGTNQALLIYLKGFAALAPRFMIVNDSGVTTTAQAAFNTTKADNLSCVKLSNNNAVVVYRDLVDANKGKFTIYQANGTNAVPPVVYSTTVNSGVVTAKDANLLVAYSDSSSGNGLKYSIYDPTGALVTGSTVLTATAFYPVDVGMFASGRAVALGSDGAGKFFVTLFNP